MSFTDPQKPNLPSQKNKQAASLVNTGLWIIVLYLPTFILSIMFGMYSYQAKIVDPQAWFNDGDVISLFSLLMAFFTLPLVAIATKYETERWQYLGLKAPFNLNEFRPWLLATALFIAIWWLTNTLLGVQTPESMQVMFASTDYVLLSFFVICIVAPIFEEVVFRGFLFSRFRHTFLGNSGALILTSVIFTVIHGQYSGIELLMIFSLATLLGVCRIKTGNVKYCIAIHMVNNLVSMLALYS